MNPQPKTIEQQNRRDDRLAHARRTGEYRTYPGGGGVPMTYHNGRVVPLPGQIEAAKRRRQARMAGR